MITIPSVKIPIYVVFSFITKIIAETIQNEEKLTSKQISHKNEGKDYDFNSENPDYLLNLISLNYQ